MSERTGDIVEADYTGYGKLPDTVWGWYQLRLKHKDGGREDTGPSTHAHLELLRKYAKECEHITEFGVRFVVTTWAFASAKPKKLVSVDERVCPVEPVKECCKKEGIEFEFRCEDTLTMDIEETDLLFIDTLHTYEQVLGELRKHGDKVRKYIIIHDTEKAEVGRAAVDFLYDHKDWCIKEVLCNSYGLTVLRKL